MSRKERATKKEIWKDFSLSQKLFTFLRGEDYARSPEMFDFANNLGLSCDCTNKIPTSLEGFAKRINEWDGQNVIKFMIEVTNLVFECYAAEDSKRLHDFADAITSWHSPISKAVDPERDWLLSYLYGMDIFREDESSKEPKRFFSEVRNAFHKKFPDTKISDSDLRKMVKELGYKCLREKTGPKGPRIKH
ncbi:MAG TPA: hypothetical protein VNU95_03875 [Candidatus Acidoferrales bacterium]|jgi:hypothetical protein|nr:hypothetical protein [Candidatus Acidoferrales bacterium]